MRLPVIRVVRDDVAIWLVYAGLRRRHFETFQRSRSIFLELPGFGASQDTFADETKTARHLAMSSAVRKWLLEQQGPRPTSRISAYEPATAPTGTPESRALAAELGNIERMFVEMQIGDIVLCPPIGHYNNFLIGEVSSRWTQDQVLPLPYFDNEEVPVRKVRWLSENVTRRDFPPKIAKFLQNQHAVSRVDNAFVEEILRICYRNFAWTNKSKIDVYGNGYTGDDPLQLNASAFMMKYVLSAISSFYAGEFEQFQALEFKQAIDRYYNKSDVEHFRINFNSPGRFETIFASKSASSLISALVGLATSNPSTPIAQARADNADAVKKAIKGDAPEIKTDVDRLISACRDDRWDRVRREIGNPANAELGLDMDMPRTAEGA